MGSNCTFEGCNNLAKASLGVQEFCPVHFILASYERLKECEQLLSSVKYENSLQVQSILTSLEDIAHQAAQLGSATQGLTSLERTRLVDIVLKAASLSPNMRGHS